MGIFRFYTFCHYDIQSLCYSFTGVTPYLDTLTNVVTIFPIVDDIDTANNIFTFTLNSAHPWDPNHKSVEPAGEGEDGNIDPATSSLTYTIDFQNTGNYPASFITIIDTLDTDIAFTTLHMVSSSHDYTMEFIYPNIVEWHFYDINLPDSATNFLLSQGFVKFSIDLQEGLASGTMIENTAGIYFDYNPVVLTNTVVNTLKMPDEITTPAAETNIHVYPNPAENKIFIAGLQTENYEVTISDITGKLVHSESLAGNGNTQTLDISFLPAGIYLIKITEDNISLEVQKIVKLE